MEDVPVDLDLYLHLRPATQHESIHIRYPLQDALLLGCCLVLGELPWTFGTIWTPAKPLNSWRIEVSFVHNIARNQLIALMGTNWNISLTQYLQHKNAQNSQNQRLTNA